jgi:AcrR family transcriptional regulator
MFDLKRRMHDPEKTREALKRAGARIFARDGFAGAKVDRIAAAAGVNKAMINYHFRGKRGLHAAILAEALGGLAADIEALRGEGRAPDEALRELIAVIGRRMTEHPDLPAMMLREILDGGERLDAALLPRMLSVFGTTRDIVQRGVKARRFRRVDPALTHLQLIGSLMFFFASAPFRERAVAAGRMPPELTRAAGDAGYVAHVQELMARGLAARPGGQ